MHGGIAFTWEHLLICSCVGLEPAVNCSAVRATTASATWPRRARDMTDINVEDLRAEVRDWLTRTGRHYRSRETLGHLARRSRLAEKVLDAGYAVPTYPGNGPGGAIRTASRRSSRRSSAPSRPRAPVGTNTTFRPTLLAFGTDELNTPCCATS